MAMTSTMMRPIAPAPSTAAASSPGLSSKPSTATPPMATTMGTMHSSAHKAGHKTRTLVPLRPSPSCSAASSSSATKLPRALAALAPSTAKAPQQRSTAGPRPLLAARPSKGPSATPAGATASAAAARATTSSATTTAAAVHPRLAPAGADPKRRLRPGPAAIKSATNKRAEPRVSADTAHADLVAPMKQASIAASVPSAVQSPLAVEVTPEATTPSDRAPSAPPTVKQESDDGHTPASFALTSAAAVQPKKEWVLPARAKPGRKPSEVEPPTKRKAQNRASQRAFRQRRQSYLATLEEKVQAYEQRGAEQTAEIQRVAQRIKQENEQLKQTVTKMQARIAQLEGELKQQHEQRPPSPPSRAPFAATSDGDEMAASQRKRTSWDWSAHSAEGSGGLAYKHAFAPRLEPPAIDASTTIERDCGFCTEQSPCVCSGEAVLDFGSQPQSESTRPEPTADDATRQVPLRLARARRSAEERQSRPKLWFTEPAPAPMASNSKVLVCPTVDRHPHRLPPLLFPHPSGVRPGQRGAAPWPMTAPLPGQPYAPYPARPKTIWPVYGSPSKSSDRAPAEVEPTVFRMRKQPDASLSYSMATPECSGDPSNCSACATDPALKDFCIAVAAHLQSDRSPGQDECVPLTPVILDAGNALPLRRKRPPLHGDDAASLHRSEAQRLAPISLYTNGHGRAEAPPRPRQPVRAGDQTDPRPRLWALSRSYQGVAGQSNETVHALPHARSSLAQQPYHRPQPLHHRSYVDNGAARGCLRRHTESEVSTLGPQHQPSGHDEDDLGAAAAKRESVPHAWQRIKQHPSFAQWQGGLDMLADVVTRRSSDRIVEHDEDDERGTADSDGRTKIQPTPPSLAQSLWRGASSADRGEASTEKDSLKRPRQSDQSSPSADGTEPMPVDGPSSPAQQAALPSPSAASLAHSKRRKIYVERKRVDDVLAMLDSVAPSSPRQDGAQTPSCACPLSKAL